MHNLVKSRTKVEIEFFFENVLFMKKLIAPIITSIAALLFCVACSHETKDTVPAQDFDFCSSIHSNDSSTLDQSLALIADSIKQKSAAVVLEDGGNAMMARAWLCEHAQKSIDVQYFIFATDNVGLIACDYLVRAADRGVKVRLIIDDMLVDAEAYDILTLDSHPNIDIKIYNPGVNLGKNLAQKLGKFAGSFHDANQRMHNKTFTVDGKAVITGGRNIADEYFDYDHEYNFRDRDVLLFGEVVKNVESSFEQFWNNAICVPVTELVTDTTVDVTNNQRFERLHQYACNPENFWPQVREKITLLPQVFKQLVDEHNIHYLDSVEFVSDVPRKNTEATNYEGGNTTSRLADLIRHAQKSICIQSPYLITTTQMRALLKAAHDRGVEIKILTNSLASTDNLEAFNGYQRNRKELLETGARIFEFRPDAKVRYDIMTGDLQKSVDYKPIFGLHAKSMVVDEKITVVGTFNFDPRSANYNTECVTILHNTALSMKVLEGMLIELKPENAWETRLDTNPDGYAERSKRISTKLRRVVPKGIL